MKSRLRMLISIAVFVIVIGFFCFFADRIRYSNEAEQKAILQNALTRMITECYAMEGSYPPDVDYLVEHYGLTYDEDEYWIDYPTNKEAGLVGMEMPVKYVVEMFCDRLAASRNYNKDKYTDGDSLEYYLRGRGHYVIHPKTDELLYSLLKMLADKGEDYTFAYIKENVLK